MHNNSASDDAKNLYMFWISFHEINFWTRDILHAKFSCVKKWVKKWIVNLKLNFSGWQLNIWVIILKKKKIMMIKSALSNIQIFAQFNLKFFRSIWSYFICCYGMRNMAVVLCSQNYVCGRLLFAVRGKKVLGQQHLTEGSRRK